MKYLDLLLNEEKIFNKWISKEIYAEKDFFEILIAQLVANTAGILAGSLIAFYKDALLLIPGLLILIPGFLEMKGSIFGSLNARIGSALHVNKKVSHRFILSNITSSFILAIILSTALGLIAFLATKIIFGVATIKIVYFSLIAGIISSLILIPVSVKTNLWLFKHGYDPDDIMGPYITSLEDIISIIAFVIAMMLI